ncbi:MAG: 4a-hydroxytetrahydrobiopterin dehydratase [Nitrospiria bacterium]
MTMGLTAKTCVPCKGGVLPLSQKEAKKLLAQIPGWELKEGATKIEGKFKFDNFVSALKFVNKVGELAESEGHHPDINFGWGYCDIIFFTHKINGLHENDFIMAAKVNQLR